MVRIDTSLRRKPASLVVPAQAKELIRQSIINTIRLKGPISYSQLMALMLYHPAEGFYTRHLLIDKKSYGHFSTRPVEFSPYYGRALAKKLLAYAAEMTQPPASLVALGDGPGVLLHDTLVGLQRCVDPRLDQTELISLELVPRFAAIQQARLAGFNVKVISGSALALSRHCAPTSGLFFMHELIDQFPLHKVINRGGELKERLLTVSRNGHDLVEVDGPLTDPLLNEYCRIAGRPPLSRARFVNAKAFQLLKELAATMTSGFAVIIDYGERLESEPWGTSARFGPVSLRADNVWEALGRDITADANFRELRLLAGSLGLQPVFNGSEATFFDGLFPKQLQGELGYPMHVLVLKASVN